MTFFIIIIVFIFVVIIAVLINKTFNSNGDKGVINLEIENSSNDNYKRDSRAVVISCYFNPQESPYRLKAFNTFYEKIKHLDHRIIECVIGDSEPELPQNENIKRIYTKSLLWHKESILNKIIAELPKQYEYIFWLDADVIFENKNWLIDGIQALQTCKIIQPFEYGVHLERDQRAFYGNPESINNQIRNKLSIGKDVMNIRVWKSFCATFREDPTKEINNYDLHGHVGFAWGVRRDVLEKVSLYDKALIGGADHIIAHAAAGQIPHKCINKAFSENIDEIIDWSQKFHQAVGEEKNVGFVKGTLLHLWHGELSKRDYLNRIRINNAKIQEIKLKDENGLYETNDDYFVQDYFVSREVSKVEDFNSSQTNIDYSNESDVPASIEYSESNSTGFDGGGAGGNWDDSNNNVNFEIAHSEASGSTFS